MNLKEALDTANWLLEREAMDDPEPQQLLRIRQLRDTVYFLYAAAGIPEILLQFTDNGGKYLG